MSHEDSGWEPQGRALQYEGDFIKDHGVGPGDINEGEQDPDFKVEADE